MENENKPVQWPVMLPLEISRVTGNIYRAEGGTVANTGFYIGKDSILAIDSKMTTEASAEMLDRMKTFSDKPVTHMILTHSDRDHVNGLAAFPAGMTIISHKNTKKEMEKAFLDPPCAQLRAYIPNRTYTDDLELDFSGIKIMLYHFGPAHTSGDTVVLFSEERTAFIGDLFFMGRDPLVHLEKNGSSQGLIKNLKSILLLEADRFISGHSMIVSKKEIEGLMNSLIEKRQKVGDMLKRGKTLDEIKTEFKVVKIQMSPGRPGFPSLVEVMVSEIREEQA